MGPPAQLPRVRSQGQMETSRPWASITWACRTRRASSSGCGTDAEVKGGERKERGVCVCGARGSCQEAAGPTPGPFPPAPGGLEMGRSLPRVPALRLRSGRRRGGAPAASPALCWQQPGTRTLLHISLPSSALSPQNPPEQLENALEPGSDPITTLITVQGHWVAHRRPGPPHLTPQHLSPPPASGWQSLPHL